MALVWKKTDTDIRMEELIIMIQMYRYIDMLMFC